MFSTLKNKIKKIIKFPQKRFPYIYEINEELVTRSTIKFNINNPIEEFRLKDWGYEKDYVLSMIKNISAEDIFLDIGASVGLVSILAGFKVTKGLVISIEPDPENYDLLIKNYRLNKLKNYIAFPFAAGDFKGTMQLYTNGSNGLSPSLQKVNGIENCINIDVEQIDNLVFTGHIPIPTILKIDIEGAELLALRGMKNLLTSEHKPRLIFLEIHPVFLSSFNTCASEVEALVLSHGYTIIDKIERDEQLLCTFKS